MKLVLFGKTSFNRQTFVQRIDYRELKKSDFYSNWKQWIWASGCENIYVKALGPPTKILDAIKSISLFKVISVFYAEN